MAQDFWRNSGFHLLERNGAGRLRVTDDFLRAYLLRPELRPVAESGPGEIALHERLLDEPRRPVAAGELDAVEDADARSNLKVWLDFRARLLEADSLEACYRGLFDADVRTPPLFIDQLVQIILRNVLDGVDDPLEMRAAELCYREQKVSIDEGRILLADLETVEMHASGGTYGSLGRLIVEAQTPVKAVNLDVLDADNGALYWLRDQRHDLVISLNYGRAGIAALGRVIARWVRHFAGVEVTVTPLRADPGCALGLAHRARRAGDVGAERAVARRGGRGGAARAPPRALPHGLRRPGLPPRRTSPGSRCISRSRWTRRTSSA